MTDVEQDESGSDSQGGSRGDSQQDVGIVSSRGWGSRNYSLGKGGSSADLEGGNRGDFQGDRGDSQDSQVVDIHRGEEYSCGNSNEEV